MADLTCDRCLNGDPWRCRGRSCANWETTRNMAPRGTSRSTGEPVAINGERRRATRPPRAVPKEEFPIPPPLLAAIRTVAEEGVTPTEILSHFRGQQAPGKIPE